MSSRKVLIEAEAHSYVGYFGLDGGQIDRGYPLEERPEEPPTGTVCEREYVLLKEVTDEDGEPLERLNGFPLKAGPRKFLRGRLVTDQKEAMSLLLPPFLREMAKVAEIEIVGTSIATVVAVRQADGTEVGIPLQTDDVPPPAGVSDYAVGESPAEKRMAEMVEDAAAYAEGCQEDLDPDCEDGEIAQIRAAVKNGDVDCFGDGDGLPDSDNDGPRAA